MKIVDLYTGASADKTTIDLTHTPVLVSGVPRSILSDAQANRAKPFPWDGDYTTATAVAYSAAEGAKGLHPLATSKPTSIEGAPAHDASHTAAQVS